MQNTSLRPDLHERHISMIAFSATLGFGITIRSGKMLRLAGPGGALVIYALSCFLGWAVMGPFVEMSSAVDDITGPIWELPALLIDKTLGVAMGFTYLMVYADQIGMTAVLFKFNYDIAGTYGVPEIPGLSWGGVARVDTRIWALLALASTFLVNILPVKWYGELEYCFGYTKLIGIAIIIIAQIPINLSRYRYEPLDGLATRKFNSTVAIGPIGAQNWNKCYRVNCSTTGFMTDFFQRGPLNLTNTSLPVALENYRNGHSISEEPIVFDNSASRLAVVWTGLTFTIFSFLGPATICVAAQEARRRSRDLKAANRKTLLRLITLYMSGIFLVSFNVPYNHHRLLPIGSQAVSIGSHSPFVIAMAEARYTGLAHFSNVLFIFATWSCATSNVYVASRTLYSLAYNGKVPAFGGIQKRLRTTTESGVPRNAVIACTAFGFLGILGTRGEKPQRALDALQEIGTTFWLITFFFISITFLAYRKYLKRLPNAELQRHNRNNATYPYKSHFAPVRTWICILATALLVLLNGWFVFARRPYNINAADFVSAYLPPLVFVSLWGGVKIWNWWRHGRPMGLTSNPDSIELLTAEAEEERGLLGTIWWWIY